MIARRLAALSDKLRDNRLDHALLASLASLRYFAGYSAPIETGPSPFSSLLGLLLCERAERPVLFLADMESPPEYPAGEIGVEPFASYTVEKPLEATADLASKLLVRMKALPRSKVAIEAEELPVALLDRLRAQCPQLEFQDASSLLAELRWIKDEEELQAIRGALALCDVGQELSKKLVRAGISELELFEEVRKGMETQAGGRLPILADMVSGPRTAEIGGPPSSRRIEPGDLVISDLVPRRNGYWGDSCNTCVAGEPTGEQRKLFAGISEALQEGIERVRPGLRASDLDALLRKRVLRLGGGYPHHSGHGLGVTWHEEPRIVPYNTLPLRAGMVIALEPGIYFKGRFGMRLEYVVLVTDRGAETLSKFRHTL